MSMRWCYRMYEERGQAHLPNLRGFLSRSLSLALKAIPHKIRLDSNELKVGEGGLAPALNRPFQSYESAPQRPQS
jgi:hypothetical protein